MKKTLYLLLFIWVTLVVNAQKDSIIYTDFEPDTCRFIMADSMWRIDINNDGIMDLKFSGYVQMHVIFPLTTMLNGWEVCLPKPDTYLNSDTIYWKVEDQWGYMFEERYGFRFFKDGDYYYGWMSVYPDYDPYATPCNYNEKQSSDSKSVLGRNIHIDKMAFCTIPNYPLQWGQAYMEGIDETDVTKFAIIHPNPTNGSITINGYNIKTIEVINVCGQTVLKNSCNSNEVTIDLGNMPEGVYFIRITDDKSRKFSEKIVKNR